MKTDLKSLKESFSLGWEVFEPSYAEADLINKMERGFVYNRTQLAALRDRMQPAEYFNVILLFNRSLQGYFSSVVNTIATSPIDAEDTNKATAINVALEYLLRINDWDIMKDELQRSFYNAGLAAVGYGIRQVGYDKYGRAKNEIELQQVPYYEIILDPKARKSDYSDARFQHRFRWISRDEMRLLFPKKWKDLPEGTNFLDNETADLEYTYSDRFTNHYQIGDEYLVVDTVAVNDKGRRERIFWSGDVELSREPFKMGKLLFAYRTIRLNSSKEPEFYGIYHDVYESQNAINQAVLQIQLLANSNKIVVEKTAVDDVDEFEAAVNRVNQVIPIKRLAGIEFKDVGRDILNQYAIIDKALERIQKVLHINDSFLGQAYNQDSGKKVALQKNSSMMALRYLNTKLDMLYRYVGLDMIELMSTFMDAEMQIQTKNQITQQPQWANINTPIMMPNQATGQLEPYAIHKPNASGTGVEKLILNEPDTSLIFDRMDIKVESVPYDNNEMQDKLMLEQTIQGPMGQMLSQASPGAYFQIGALLTKEYRTKHSPEVAAILENMARQMGYQAPVADPRAVEAGMPGQPGGGQQPAGRYGAAAMTKTMGMDTNSMNLADKQ